MRPALAPPVLALAVVLTSAVARAQSAHALTGAMELVRQAREHETVHDDLVALRRYSDALQLDPTFIEAYLGLGALRLRLGDAREAEHVYSVVLARRPQLEAALRGRAEARRAGGDHGGADRDLEEAARLTEDDASRAATWRTLAGWYGEDDQRPAQLATWRKLHDLAERTADAALTHEAAMTVRALQRLVDRADPVIAPAGVSSSTPSNEVRRALAGHARHLR